MVGASIAVALPRFDANVTIATLTSSDPGEGLKVYLFLLSNQIAASQLIFPMALWGLSKSIIQAC